MPRTISIGSQSFADVRERGAFLVDKTAFVREWWQSFDDVTLVCRPRRFGKTLAMSMVECFFSTRYAGRPDLFEGLDVWRDPAMRAEQGRWPVVSLSFAGVKGGSLNDLASRLCAQVARAYRDHADEVDLDEMGAAERELFEGRRLDIAPEDVPDTVVRLCELLFRRSGSRAVLLLDEYDTPLQEAWVGGYWEGMLGVVRPLFNAAFKSNPYLERGLITGITRVARESIFSDLNNLKVVTTTSRKYETGFGFTQAEVDAALGEFGMADERDGVRDWYDGFKFGRASDIYNPWSITNFLDEGRLAPYWADTSSNGLVSSLVSRSDAQFKEAFETLLNGGRVREDIDEQLAFPDLESDPAAVWSLLVASGYLKVLQSDSTTGSCELAITNRETTAAFDAMVRRWFAPARAAYSGFVRALLAGDLEAMNAYMNDVALDTFSTFDTGQRPSGAEPERFYHGFVLGLLVELRGRYLMRSNRESGFGRYDVMLEPTDPARDDGIVLEFKVRDPRREASLEDTVAAAQAQIEERRHTSELVARGVPKKRVRAYGFAFEGKRVLIG